MGTGWINNSKERDGCETVIDLTNFVSDKGAVRAFMKFRRNPHGR